MSNTDDISVLFPNREIVVQGEKIVIKPFFFGELPVVIRLVYPIMTAAGLSQMLRVKQDDEKKFDVKMVIPENFLDIIAHVVLEAAEPVIELLMFALKKERTWFNTLLPDEGIDLTRVWFEVNKDFFVERVLQKFPTLVAMNSGGSTSLPSSSEAATEESTSTVTP